MMKSIFKLALTVAIIIALVKISSSLPTREDYKVKKPLEISKFKSEILTKESSSSVMYEYVTYEGKPDITEITLTDAEVALLNLNQPVYKSMNEIDVKFNSHQELVMYGIIFGWIVGIIIIVFIGEAQEGFFEFLSHIDF